MLASVKPVFLCAAIALGSRAAGAAEAAALVEPADGAVTTMSAPHFEWRSPALPSLDTMGDHDIQIAADPAFSRIVDEDRIAAVISRYVPDRELAAGEYWWRLAAVDSQGTRGPWSESRRFSVVEPERVFKIGRDASLAEVHRVLAQAAANTPAIVSFEPAEYRLDPGGAEAFLDLQGANGLVIDGGGSSVTFTGFLKFVRLGECRRVVVRNFSFDFDPLPYTAGRVLAVDAPSGTFDVEIEPGHPLPESNPHFDRDRKGMIVDPRYPRMKRGVDLILEHGGWKKLGDRRYRFLARNPRRLADLAPGDVYVLDPRIATGFDVDACDEIVFYNLVAYAVSNEAFNSHYGNRLSILHCGIRLKPGRFIAANNGGHNHHNARIGPWIEGCVWENTGDDICHVNCLVMGVEEKLAPDRIRLPLRNPFDAVGPRVALDILPGDVLQFFNRGAGRVLSERTVVRTSRLPNSLEVTLDGEVGDIVTGRPGVARAGQANKPADESVVQVFNAARTCNQFVFRNNTVRNGRRVGVLAKGRGGLVENNSFEGLGGGAVEFWNAPFEGLGGVDYVVRGNRVRDCGQLAREHAAFWAIGFRSGADRVHRNLLFENNEIAGFSGAAILLRDSENILIRNNRIVTAPPLDPATAPPAPIELHNTGAVRLEANIVSQPY